MKFNFVLPLSLCLLFPVKLQASTLPQLKYVCERFAAGEIDALMTLEALELNVYDVSLGINNTAKIFCA